MVNSSVRVTIADKQRNQKEEAGTTKTSQPQRLDVLCRCVYHSIITSVLPVIEQCDKQIIFVVCGSSFKALINETSRYRFVGGTLQGACVTALFRPLWVRLCRNLREIRFRGRVLWRRRRRGHGSLVKK